MMFSKHWKQAEPAPFFFSKHWKILLLVFACSALAVAQEPGAEISGFRVPDYDEKGVMSSQLFGKHAEMEGGGEVKITGVRMEFYRDGETFMEVTSPYCFFDQKTREAHSDAPVAADMERVRVRGRGFRLQSGDRTVQILSESRVIIEDVMEQSKNDLSDEVAKTNELAATDSGELEESEVDLPIEGAETNECTVITSKKLFLDYNGRTVLFEEAVHVQDPKMAMDCGTMTVRFGENNEIDWIEALTEVKLFSKEREAHAERAVYDVTPDEFLLEGSPRIMDGRNMLLGERIRFWRATGRMVCEPSARLIIFPDDKQKTELFEN